jgi:hypothetical protein
MAQQTHLKATRSIIEHHKIQSGGRSVLDGPKPVAQVFQEPKWFAYRQKLSVLLSQLDLVSRVWYAEQWLQTEEAAAAAIGHPPSVDELMTMAPCPSAVSRMNGIWCFRHKNTPRALIDITCTQQQHHA